MCGVPDTSAADPLRAFLLGLRRLEASALAAIDSLYVSRGVSEVPISAETDPIDAYVSVHGAHLHGVTREDCACAFLRWVDSPSEPMTEIGLDLGPGTGMCLAERAALLARPPTVANSSSRAVPRRRRAAAGLSAERFQWRRCAARLRSACRAQRATLREVRADRVGRGPRSHAKWAEADKSVAIAVPADAALRASHEDLSAARDALSECQRDVSSLMAALDAALDEYAAQALSVMRREEAFRRSVQIAECENRVLREFSRRAGFLAKNL